MSTKAVLVRKSRRTFGVHKTKAPSGRELPTKSGEGERVTIIFVKTKVPWEPSVTPRNWRGSPAALLSLYRL